MKPWVRRVQSLLEHTELAVGKVLERVEIVDAVATQLEQKR